MKKPTYRIIRRDDNYIIRRAVPVGSYGAMDYTYFDGYGSMGVDVYWEKALDDVKIKMGFSEAVAVMHDLANMD